MSKKHPRVKGAPLATCQQCGHPMSRRAYLPTCATCRKGRVRKADRAPKEASA